MLHTILVIAAIVAVLLLILYMLSRRFPIIGDGLAFLCVVGARVFVKIQGMLEKAGSYCNSVFEKTLNYPPNVASDTWQGVHVIARIMLLLVSSVILLGDLYGVLQFTPILYGGAGGVTLPGSFAIPSALLFVAMSTLYGAVVLECTNLLPYGAGLFPKMTEKVRKWLGVLCGIGFMLSLVFAVMFWIFRGWFLADPESAGVLAIPVFALVGLLVTGASVLALWGLVVGLTGLASVFFWLLSTVFHLAAHIVSLVPSLLDVVALHYTRGTMSVYGDFLGHDPYKAPSSPFPLSRQLLPGQKNTAIAVLPQHASTILDADVETIVPVETQEVEISPMNLEKSAALAFYGGFGQHMFPPVAKVIVELDATNCIKSSSFIVLPVTNMDTGIPGVVNRTPTIAKRHAVSLHCKTQGEAYKKLIDSDADTLIETHIDLKSVPAPMIFFIGCHELIETVDALESLKRRYPLCKIVVLTELSSLDLQDKIVQVGLSDMQALVAEDIVETIMISDPNSAFAQLFGLETQHRFLAKLIVSLVIADTHSTTNVAFSDVLSMLHRSGACTVINATSKAVVVGKLPGRYRWLPGVKGHVGTGNLADILAQSQACIDEVLTKEETAMYPVPGDPGVLRVVAVNVPVKLSEERFLVVCRELALHVSTNHPNTLCLTTRGNGTAPIRHFGSRFLVQASCLTPVPNPASLLRAHHEPSVKVTQLHAMPAPDPLTTNGNVPAIGNNRLAKAAKPISTARQKKTARRVVVRKNSKQAK